MWQIYPVDVLHEDKDLFPALLPGKEDTEEAHKSLLYERMYKPKCVAL